ncbi:hypothetical protein GCM10023188_30100 [Pontibacter saemangeumensis]|uniref:ABC transmembrane type-1 domain-containing protein n=1 Tax=Pontibacter saemangeumensis TaxID=1084525 RepID=A0ABP8LTT8_9BACT
MGGYLLRRFLLAIPALWALATVVFLLSRLLPGTYGSERILQSGTGYYSKGSETDRQAAYLSYVKRTGQDMPLFYLSAGPATHSPAETAVSYTKQTQEQLTKLSWRYGAQNAKAYIQSVAALKKQWQDSYHNAVPGNAVAVHLQTLQAADNTEPLVDAAEEIRAAAGHPRLRRAADNVLVRLQAMQPQGSLAFLLPAISWHGSQNQYHQWLVQLLHGNLGNSYKSSRPVLEVLVEAVGNTWWLLICSMVITFFLALELSVLMAQKKENRLRKVLLPLLFMLDSIPPFVLALLLLVLLANPNFIQLFPVFGMGYYMPQELGLWQELMQWAYFMALPLLSLVLFNLPYLTSQIHSAISAAMQSDFTRTARAKGLAESAVIRKHALRNSLLPIITIVSDFIPALVTGTLIVETVFAVPGVGRLLLDAVLSRDYPMLTGIVLIIAAFRIAAYLLADMAYAWADPRIRQRMT